MITLKNEKQIEGIRTSCKYLAELFLRLEEFIEPGMSTMDIDKYSAEFIRKIGGSSCFSGIWRISGNNMFLCQ